MNASKIQILPPEVVDQIAAGEVVERPAHMVKELVENAIDAGATEVRVQFEKGGRCVQVSDNGRGMQKHELALALSRHATSKIATSDELWSLSSFGFRGEALASIASVSRVVLRSRPAEASATSSQKSSSDKSGVGHLAWQLDAEFGKLRSPHVVGGEVGTRIVIDDLFSNTPARLKFLKSDTAEGVQIKEVLKALALSHPGVSFYIKSKELIFCWPRASFLERAQQVLEVPELHENKFVYEQVQAHVLVAAPNTTARTRKSMWCFVQNRFVQDKTMQAAVLEAYRNLLMHREYPVGVFFLNLPDGEVDVNIHPTKSQVKFRSSQNAFRALNRCVREKLEQAPWLNTLLSSEPAQSNNPDVPTVSNNRSTQHSEGDVVDVKGSAHRSAVERPTAEAIEQRTAWGQLQQSQSLDPQDKGAFNEGPSDVKSFEMGVGVQKPIVNYAQGIEKVSSSALGLQEGATSGQWGGLRALAQVQRTYIVTQTSKAMILIDQHAACERVLFERLWHSWRDKKIKSQYKMIGLNLKMSAEKLECLLSNKAALAKMGFIVEAAGPELLALMGTPAGVRDAVLPGVIEKLADDMLKYGTSFAFEKVISDILATMACHSAIRAGQELTQGEMQTLLEQMDEHPLSSFCPHGRPVFVEIPFSKLERDFGRKV